jgi:hypothetical protein
MAKILELPPRKFLMECFDYDAINGVLIWKDRPRNHFSSDASHKAFLTRCSGKEAGNIQKDGIYVRLVFNGNHLKLLAHRIAYVISGGKADTPIMFINKNNKDIRLCNLMPVSRQDLTQKRGLNSNNKTGFRSVILLPNGMYQGSFVSGGVKYRTPTFKTAEEANQSRIELFHDVSGEMAVYG